MGRKAVGVTERKDGRLTASFTMNGKRYYVYGKSTTEIREKEILKRQQIAEEAVEKSKTAANRPLREYAEKWVESKRGTVKETTIRNNKMFLAMTDKVQVMGQDFGSVILGEVKTDHIRILQSELRKGRQTRTVNDCISLLRSLFKSAIDEQLISYNPAACIKPLKRTEEAARDTVHRALSRAETGDFLKAAKEQNSANYNLYVFLLNTGCRIGEAAALTIWDINNGKVRISRSVTRTESGGYKIGDDTKTAAGRRTIPLTEEAQKAIEAQKALNVLLYGEGANDNKPIFRPIRGKVLNGSVVNEDVKRICAEAGIERFTVHAFRDTFATRCVESGMQPKTLQEIMGHTDINMTMALYAHVMDETKTEQLRAVNFS